MKMTITKRISSLMLAFAVVLTTVFAGATEAKAADTKTIYVSEDWVETVAGEESTFSFTVTQNQDVELTVMTALPSDTVLKLYDSAMSEISGTTVYASDYQQTTISGTTVYGFVYGWTGGLKPGDYSIGLTFSNANLYSAAVRQENITPTISQKSATITQGFTQKLSVTGGSVNSWSSKNKAIATVDKKGKVTAKKPGSTIITATLKTGKKLTCKVKVVANKYTDTKITTANCPYGKVYMSAYNAEYDKSGNLVIKAQCVNKSGYKITRFENIKITVTDAKGKTIGVYKQSKKNVGQANNSSQTYTFTIQKSALKQKNADLRNARAITMDGSYVYYYRY